MRGYECKLCAHVSTGHDYETAFRQHRKHYRENHDDGQFRLYWALPRRVEVKP